MKKELRKLLLVLLIFTSVFISIPLGSVVQLQAATKLCDEFYTSNMITIKKGGSYTLKMNYNGKTFASSKFKFKSSDSKVVSVSSKGVLKGKKIGSAKVYVTSKSNKKVKATICVTINSTGPQAVQGGTVETSYGVKIPVVSEFNKIGLIEGNDWTGEGTAGNDYDKAYGKALKEYSKVANYGIHDAPILPAGDYAIHNGTAWDEMGPVTLWRNIDMGRYFFYYTIDLSDLNDDAIQRQRDLSLFMLSMITSTPTEVEKAIYESAFTAPDDKEPIPTSGKWAKIGDCQIKFTWFRKDPFILEYAIRSAPESVVKKYRAKSEKWIKEEAAKKAAEEFAKRAWDELKEPELPQDISDDGTITIERVNTPDLNTYRMVNPTSSTAYVSINNELHIYIPRGKTVYFQGPEQTVEITKIDLPSKKIMKDASPIIELKDGGVNYSGRPTVEAINHTIKYWSAHAYVTFKDKNGIIVGGAYEDFECDDDEFKSQEIELYPGTIYKGTYPVKQKNGESEIDFSFEAEQRYVRPVDNNKLIGNFNGITLTEEQSYCYLFSVPLSDGYVGDFYFNPYEWGALLDAKWFNRKEVPGYMVKNGNVYEVVLDTSEVSAVPWEYARLETEVFVSK
ncbi:MAG: Ig-like domain-containing protein [Lachnospiraceae bacterium]|nr:Ig-like domain-containing protein [Lachnospiraceae bacterium]